MTDDLYTAKRFVDVMRTGFPEYGAFISPAKTLLSFDCPSMPLAQRCQGDQFPFCGFVLGTTSLDMGMDYSRVLSGRELSQVTRSLVYTKADSMCSDRTVVCSPLSPEKGRSIRRLA